MSYRTRLKEALNPRKPELYARLGVGTALATAAFNLLFPGADSPVSVRQDPMPDRVVTRESPDKFHYEPSEIAPIVEHGPGAKIDVPQAYAPDFTALPLSEVTLRQVTDYASELHAVTSHDPSAFVTVRIVGTASDESRADSVEGDVNLGRASEKNAALARARGRLAELALRELVADDPRITVSQTEWSEEVLSPEEVVRIDQIAESAGMSRQGLLAMYNEGRAVLDENDAATMARLFDARRGALFDASVARNVAPAIGPCDKVVTKVTTPGETITLYDAGHGGWKLDVVPAFIPPLPRRRPGDNAVETASPSLPPEGDAHAGTAAFRGASAGRADRGRHRPEYIRRQHQVAEDAPHPARHRNRYVRRALGALAAAAAVFPWPSWHDQTSVAAPVAVEDCVRTEVEPGRKRDVSVSFPVLDALDRLTGNHFPSTGVHVHTATHPDLILRTRADHTIFEVDGSGKIVTQTYVPETTQRDTAVPRFEE